MKFLNVTALIFATTLLTSCASVFEEGLVFDKPKASLARVNLALNYLENKDFTQAKKNLDKALSYTPKDPQVLAAFAYYYQRQGNVAEAEKFYQQALSQKPQKGEVYNNYAVFLCEKGEYQAAFNAFKQALETPNYYNQVDTFENITLCAFESKQMPAFKMGIEQLQRLDPVRAKRVQDYTQSH